MIEAYGRITPPQAQQTDNAWALLKVSFSDRSVGIE